MVNIIKCDTVRDVVNTVNKYELSKKDIINIFPFKDNIIIIYEIK